MRTVIKTYKFKLYKNKKNKHLDFRPGRYLMAICRQKLWLW